MSEAVVDASILVRLLTEDDPDLALRATRLLQAATDLHVRVLVLPATVAEVVYVLAGVYEWQCGDIAAGLFEFFDTSLVSVLDRRAIIQALLWFRDLPRIQFADAYLAAVADAHGHAVMSFDRGFRRVPGIRLLDDASQFQEE